MCIEYTGKISRFEKGQVWFVEEPEDLTKLMKRHNEKVIVGTRPYLIISVGDTNSDKGTISCIPITTNCDPVSSLLSQRDIIAKTPEGLRVRFLVDQITCKTTNNFRDFKYSIPDDLMRGIEFQIQHRLGIQSSENNIFDVSKKFWRPEKRSENTDHKSENNNNFHDNTKVVTVEKAVAEKRGRSLPIKTEDEALQFIIELEKVGYNEYIRIHKCTASSLYQRINRIYKKYGIRPEFHQ